LPDGVELLALEYNVMMWDPQKNEWEPKQKTGFALNAKQEKWLDNIVYFFNAAVGGAERIKPNENTMFGLTSHYAVRMNMVASTALLDARFNGKIKLDEQLGISFRPGIGVSLALTHARRLNTLHTRERDDDSYYCYKDRCREDYASFADFVKAIQMADNDFADLRLIGENVDGDSETILECLWQARREVELPQFLVDGLVPKRVVTLLLGAKKAGKSTLAVELGTAVALRQSHWLGMPLDVGKGRVAFLIGEDTEESVRDRVASITGGAVPHLLWLFETASIDDILAEIGEKPISLLVVDPARKFYDGDEDSSDAVNKFFTKLETFARAKDCPVLVLHHLRRGAAPRNIHDIAESVRGSGVWLDRPRVILGLHRTKAESQFGICTSGGIPMHNFRASAMVSAPMRLRQDADSHRHVLVGAATSAEPVVVTSEVEEAVLAAARRIIGVGPPLVRTGKNELYARYHGSFGDDTPTELEGLSRATVRAAVDALIRQGRLANDDGVITRGED
jgi:hypothetical protein